MPQMTVNMSPDSPWTDLHTALVAMPHAGDVREPRHCVGGVHVWAPGMARGGDRLERADTVRVPSSRCHPKATERILPQTAFERCSRIAPRPRLVRVYNVSSQFVNSTQPHE